MFFKSIHTNENWRTKKIEESAFWLHPGPADNALSVVGKSNVPPEMNLRPGSHIDSSNLEVFGLTSCAGRASSHLHNRGPDTASTALERGATNAVPHTLRAASTAQGTTAGAGVVRRRSRRAGWDDRGSRRRCSSRRCLRRSGRNEDARCDSLASRSRRHGLLRRRDGRRSGSGRGRGGRSAHRHRNRCAGAGTTGAGSLTDGQQVCRVTKKVHGTTRVWEPDVDALRGHAAVDVGHEHVRKVLRETVALGDIDGLLGGWCIALLLRSCHSNWSAVHIHLAVSNSVEPCPCESIFTRSDAVGNGELERRRIRGFCATIKVSSHVGWASTFDGVDYLPLRILGGILVCGQADLTGPATMSSTADKAE